jgi:hypothetical protein
MKGARLLPIALVAAVACRPRETPRPPDAGAKPLVVASVGAPRSPMPAGYLKGQLHAHTSRSADSTTTPRDVHRWYEAHGYDFVVFTDHNVVTDTDDTRLLTMPGVELTRSLRTCEPPPAPGEGCLLHMNVLFVKQDVVPLGEVVSASRREIYRQELRCAQELGGVAMLNHPNMQHSLDVGLVVDLAKEGVALLEVGNQAWDSENAGDERHPSSEAIWDGALGRGARVFGTATDDAHFYGDVAAARASGERPFPAGLGFVVVHADRNAASIREAVVRGDFYASTGVLFATHTLTKTSIALATVDVAAVLFEVVGRDGVVLQRLRGPRLDLALGAKERPYVRVRATRDDGAIAWTQPVFPDPP